MNRNPDVWAGAKGAMIEKDLGSRIVLDPWGELMLGQEGKFRDLLHPLPLPVSCPLDEYLIFADCSFVGWSTVWEHAARQAQTSCRSEDWRYEGCIDFGLLALHFFLSGFATNCDAASLLVVVVWWISSCVELRFD